MKSKWVIAFAIAVVLLGCGKPRGAVDPEKADQAGEIGQAGRLQIFRYASQGQHGELLLDPDSRETIQMAAFGPGKFEISEPLAVDDGGPFLAWEDTAFGPRVVGFRGEIGSQELSATYDERARRWHLSIPQLLKGEIGGLKQSDTHQLQLYFEAVSGERFEQTLRFRARPRIQAEPPQIEPADVALGTRLDELSRLQAEGGWSILQESITNPTQRKLWLLATQRADEFRVESQFQSFLFSQGTHRPPKESYSKGEGFARVVELHYQDSSGRSGRLDAATPGQWLLIAVEPGETVKLSWKARLDSTAVCVHPGVVDRSVEVRHDRWQKERVGVVGIQSSGRMVREYRWVSRPENGAKPEMGTPVKVTESPRVQKLGVLFPDSSISTCAGYR
jgi:hypothetical protein